MSDAPQHHGEHKIAIVLSAELASGHAANVAACIAAGLAAAQPGWSGLALADAQGFRSASSSHLPIAVLRAEAPTLAAMMQRLAAEDEAASGVVSLFPAYAQRVHNCEEYWARHRAADHTQEALLGVGLAGAKRWVNRLTGSMALWR